MIVLLGSAGAKLAKVQNTVDTMSRVGLPVRVLPVLAALEVAGALGLIAGFFWWPLGVAAAVGVTLYFAGASISHLRVGDFKNLPPAAVLFVFSVIELALLFATHR